MRAFLYGRVSKDQHRGGRKGRSVSQQLSIGKRRCTENQWDISGVYSDNDVSASEYAGRKREDWERLMGDIRDGHGDILWVWEISRGTRERLVWANLAALCQQRQMWICIDDRMYDTTEPDDMRYLDNLIADAIHESGKTRKRIMRDLEASAMEGRPHGRPGYGFTREYDPVTKDFLRQVPNPPEAEIVREVVRRFLAGETLNSIASDLNRRGVRTPSGKVAGEPSITKNGLSGTCPGWSHKTLQDSITRVSLIGKRGYKGQVIAPEDPSSWLPIISEEEFEEVQRKLRKPANAPRRTRRGRARWYLSGIARCEACGGPMTSAGKVPSVTYECGGAYPGASRGHVRRTVERLHAHVEALLVRRFSRPDVLEAFAEDVVTAEDVASTRREIARLEGDLEQLYEDVKARRVSRQLAAADEEGLKAEIARLEEKARPAVIDKFAVALADPDPHRVKATWDEWSVDQKRLALLAVTERIVVLRVGNVGSRPVSVSESVRVVWKGEE